MWFTRFNMAVATHGFCPSTYLIIKELMFPWFRPYCFCRPSRVFLFRTSIVVYRCGFNRLWKKRRAAHPRLVLGRPIYYDAPDCFVSGSEIGGWVASLSFLVLRWVPRSEHLPPPLPHLSLASFSASSPPAPELIPPPLPRARPDFLRSSASSCPSMAAEG
jgi:hypothetical protein